MALHTGLIFVVGSVHCLYVYLKVNTQNDVILIGRDRIHNLVFMSDFLVYKCAPVSNAI